MFNITTNIQLIHLVHTAGLMCQFKYYKFCVYFDTVATPEKRDKAERKKKKNLNTYLHFSYFRIPLYNKKLRVVCNDLISVTLIL